MKKTELIKKIQELINEARKEGKRVFEDAKKEKDRAKCRELFLLAETLENYRKSLISLKKFIKEQNARVFRFECVDTVKELEALERRWAVEGIGCGEEHATAYTTVDLVERTYYVQMDSLQSVMK